MKNCILVIFTFISFIASAQDDKEREMILKQSGEREPVSAGQVCPLMIGSAIPDVTVQTIEDEQVSLREQLIGQKSVIIFYRGSWCPHCNRHLSGISEIEAELSEMGYQIVAISPDQPKVTAETMEEQEGSYALFSDSKMAASDAFGLTFDAKGSEKLEKASGEAHHQLPVPALFITNEDGVIEFVYANPDYKQRMSPQMLMSVAEALLEQE